MYNPVLIPADQIRPSKVYEEALSQAWHLFEPVLATTIPTKFPLVIRPRLYCRKISEGYFAGGIQILRSKLLDSKASTINIELFQHPRMSEEEMHYWMLQDICNSFNLINFVSNSPSDVGLFLIYLIERYPAAIKQLLGARSKLGLSKRFGCSKNTLFPTRKYSARQTRRMKLDPSLFANKKKADRGDS